MRGFWRGLITGGVIFTAINMYMNAEQKTSYSIIGRRNRQANQVIKGISKTVKALMR